MKQATLLNQWTIQDQDTHLLTWIEAFLFDRKAQGLSKGTVHFYTKKLELFCQFCEGQVIKHITEITPPIIREYLVWLEQRGHNPGGIHACYRSLRAFLYWWENELEPEGWKNPVRKVKAPKVKISPLVGASLDTIRSMIEPCESDFYGKRDKAIFTVLLDTGVRAAELCAMNLEDMNATRTNILIPEGKGGKPRTVFLGKTARKALRGYLREPPKPPALWTTKEGTRLTYWGLRQIVRRRAKQAGIDPPKLHDFRRAFALNSLRNGADIYSLQKLMGHSDIQVLRRYLAQTTEDIRLVHRNTSPADRL